MNSRIQMLLLISNILLCFNNFVESSHFVDEVKQIEKEIVAIEPVGNVEKTQEIREYLNQFYHEICTSRDLQAGTLRPFFTTNVRINTGGKRVS